MVDSGTLAKLIMRLFLFIIHKRWPALVIPLRSLLGRSVRKIAAPADAVLHGTQTRRYFPEFPPAPRFFWDFLSFFHWPPPLRLFLLFQFFLGRLLFFWLDFLMMSSKSRIDPFKDRPRCKCLLHFPLYMKYQLVIIKEPCVPIGCISRIGRFLFALSIFVCFVYLFFFPRLE